MTEEYVRQECPRAAEVFDAILEEHGRKHHPWKELYRGYGYVMRELSDVEQPWAERLDRHFLKRTFDDLCSKISNTEGVIFDAWGPFDLPSWRAYRRGLETQEERDGLHLYVRTRRRHAIPIETGRSYIYVDMVELYALLDDAEDDRQRFRFISSIVEYIDDHRAQFSEGQIEEIKKMHQILNKKFGGRLSLAHLLSSTTLEPLRWTGKLVDLHRIMEAVKNAGLLEATVSEIVSHFTWKHKKDHQKAVKRYHGVKDDLRRSESTPDNQAIQQVVAELTKDR